MVNENDDVLEIYKKTGTLAPLVNKRKYSENEKIVLLHFFTNIDKNVYCATDALTSQLWAFLVGQYSRSELSMRDRFLKLFEDAKKAYEQEKITKDEFVSLEDMADSIKKGNLNTLKYFNDKASNFLKKWGVNYGHNSLKDADRIRFAIEGVSEVYTKVIESPFPCLGDFQEKSTRYLHFGKENIIYSPGLARSKYGGKIKKLNEKLMDIYEKYTPIVKSTIIKNKIIKREDFTREGAYKNTLDAKTFDTLRYLLPTGTSTSLGAGFSARTAETHISEMMSHPIEEVRLIAKSMHKEALKISPGLLSHVKENEYLKIRRNEGIKLIEDIFFDKITYDKNNNNSKIIRGLDNKNKVTLISTQSISMDDMIVTSILFEYSRERGYSYKSCLKKAQNMTDDEKLKVFDVELKNRGEFDRMPRALQHGSVLFEFLFDFGAYRDVQRHRAAQQLYQGATAIHGYDYPEFIDLPELCDMKKEYDEVMSDITLLSRKIIKEFPYENEYVAALGHLMRTTFEMHPGQLAYVCELRTTPQGHYSYRNIFQEVYRIIEKEAPLYAKYFRVNNNVEASRVKQEEKAAKKREKLGIK